MAFRGSGAALVLRGLRSSAAAVLQQEGPGFSASFPAAQLATRNAVECAHPAQPSTAARPCPCPDRSRGIRTGSLLWDSVQAVVPSMGDSITEGTIAPGTIAKAPGDAVAEDEVIAQIETDKVTIDVRAPTAGVITDLMIKDDDTVTVGQVIANIDTESSAQPAAKTAKEEEPAKAEQAQQSSKGKKAAEPKAAPPPEPAQTQAESTPTEAPESPAAQAYKPRIRFPPRYTPDGRRISSLPAEEAARVLAELEGGDDGAASSSPAPAEEQPQQSQQAVPHLSGVSAALRRPPAPRPGLDSTRPGRRLLDEREMEMIELGGAPP